MQIFHLNSSQTQGFRHHPTSKTSKHKVSDPTSIVLVEGYSGTRPNRFNGWPRKETGFNGWPFTLLKYNSDPATLLFETFACVRSMWVHFPEVCAHSLDGKLINVSTNFFHKSWSPWSLMQHSRALPWVALVSPSVVPSSATLVSERCCLKPVMQELDVHRRDMCMVRRKLPQVLCQDVQVRMAWALSDWVLSMIIIVFKSWSYRSWIVRYMYTCAQTALTRFCRYSRSWGDVLQRKSSTVLISRLGGVISCV